MENSNFPLHSQPHMNSFRRHFLVALLLAALGLVAYWGSLRNGFVWDDNFQIGRNPYIHATQPWLRLLTSDVWGYIRGGQVGLSNYYRPLQMLTYRLVAEAAGLDPTAYHAVSLLLHIFASLAAYGLMFQLSRRQGVAAAAGVLFATHPIHSEAVLWIAALTELGCALFYFVAGTLFLMAYREPPPTLPAGKKSRKPIAPVVDRYRRRWLVGASVLSFFVAILWKEMALTLPVVIAVYVFFTDAQASWRARLQRAAWRSLPYWAAIAVYVPIRMAVLGYFSIVQHGWVLTPSEYVLSTIELLGKYWLKLLLPLNLNAYHMFYPARTLLEARALGAIVFLVVAAALVLGGMRRRPLPAFCAAWVFLTLVPVLNLRGVGENVFAERYLYIPSLGFCLLAAWLGAEALQRLPRRMAGTVAAATLVVVAALGTVAAAHRVAVWQSDYTLYADSVAKSPGAALMHASLAQILRDEKGDFAGARREYEVALRVAQEESPPNKLQMANAYVGLSGIATHERDFQRALATVNQALAIDDKLPGAHLAKGIIVLQMGHLEEARVLLEESHKYFPYDEVALNGLGIIALARRDYPTAVDYFRQTVEFVPQYADGFNNLGRAYLEMGDRNHALSAFQRAVELAPQNALFHTNYGVALGRADRLPEARGQFERALVLSPGFVPAQQNLQLLQQLESQRAAAPRR